MAPCVQRRVSFLNEELQAVIIGGICSLQQIYDSCMIRNVVQSGSRNKAGLSRKVGWKFVSSQSVLMELSLPSGPP